jgi:site-specific recombinase XerD
VSARSFTDTDTWHDYRFHLSVERQRRASTVAAYANTLNRWGRFLGRRDWQQATSRDLGRFLAQQCGQGQHRAGQPLSDAAKRHYTAALKSFYRWATDTELLQRDPMARVVLGRTPTPLPRDIAPADMRSLLVWIQGDTRAELAVSLGYFAGLRVSEIASLRVEHVVLHGPRPHLRVLDGKAGRSRLIPLAAPLRDVLGRYLAQRPGAGPVLCRRHPSDGRPMTGKTVTDVIRGAMKAAGINARPHDLRHSFATRLLERGHGQNLLSVSKLLGHANSALTEQVYGLGYRGELDETMDLMPDPRRSGP